MNNELALVSVADCLFLDVAAVFHAVSVSWDDTLETEPRIL